MPRGAAVVYPKDAAQILMAADIFPAPGCWKLALDPALDLQLAAGDRSGGRLISYERREDFAAIARRNVENFFGANLPNWVCELLICSSRSPRTPDRGVGHAAPWDYVAALAEVLIPAGVLRLRRDHHPARRDGGDFARSQRLYRAGGHRVVGPGLAR